MNETPPVESSLADYLKAGLKEVGRNPQFGPGGIHFGALVRAYLPLVYGTALKLVPERPESAAAIAESTFECLASRWKRLPKRSSVGFFLTCVSTWLLRATVSVSLRERKRLGLGEPPRDSAASGYLQLFHRLFRLRRVTQNSVVLFHILKYPPAQEPPGQRIEKYQKIAVKAVAKLGRKLRKTSIGADVSAALGNIPVTLPPETEAALIENLRRWTPSATSSPLTRATLVSWRWLAVRTFFKRVLATVGAIVCLLAVLAFTFVLLAQHGYLNQFFLRQQASSLAKEFPEMAAPARPWPVSPADHALARTELPRDAADLYQSTHIWVARLSFTPEQWEAVQPSRIPPVPDMWSGGQINLRNPKAKRSGLSGVLGIDFNWAEAQLDFAGARFEKVAARYRGNGTYVNSLYGPKQSFKVDLNKYVKKQSIGGVNELNFVNSIPDFSYVRDSMAQRVFRDLGVPAPRTAYAYLSVDAPHQWTNQPFGLYCLIENIDKDFAEDRFGTRKVPIFKPVTYQLFEDIGATWNDYAEIYDLKTEATPEQLQRLIEFAHLVSHASDDEFAKRIGEFLDLEVFAGFLAGHVLLSSYDGFLTNGQNYYLYLDPGSNRFGFISWDQDHSWGEFPYVGTAESRENASIWKPWIAKNKFLFLERTLQVPAFRELYEKKLETALATFFTKESLYAQVDELAAAIRPAVAAESDFRLKRFETSVSSEWVPGPRDGDGEGPKSPVHQIKRFIENRITSLREQLDGKSDGVRPNSRF